MKAVALTRYLPVADPDSFLDVDLPKPDLRMGMLTVACIQPARSDIDRAVLEAELVALCREKLTRYKIPDEWRFLDSFPRNAMGKIVKPKLRELVQPRPEKSRGGKECVSTCSYRVAT